MTLGLPGTQGRRRIYLMRHGEVDYKFGGKGVLNPDAVELTNKGQNQAALMGEALADIAFDLTAHTGLLRTKQTLNAALDGRDMPIEEIGSLREIKTGRFAELTPERIEAEFVYGFETAHLPGACFAGGEEFAAFYNRIADAMVTLLARNDWTTALLVCHGGTNRAVLSWVTHGGPEGMASFEQDTGCLNVIDADVIDGEIIRRFVRTINFTPYDPIKTGKYLTNMELYRLGRSG
jgi:broad specificity phosphatase PhoE